MDSFVEYTVELLEKLGPVQARRMFGGWGLYFGGRMFGLIGDGQLYLKTDEISRPEFQAAGCRPFVWEGGGQRIEMSYWTPPADASDDAYALLPWARRGVDAATRAALKKAPKKKAAAKKTPAEPAKKAAAPRKATKTPAKKAPAKKPSAKKKPAAKKASTARKAKPSSRRR
ncbi:TfoX/Sxy family protein [Myxococcus sp. MISCRS1]|uniref:TfoX/Sxy family protein n=1 Tax=Myxococcus sp. MISCRS1 TaxID=2996786 RepID=UPI002272237C|nr:TfoX/Sxy family protein [Myxococcus sp. MISCRS1]MCY0997749.1 TfoX/Sxy family protein [Myxococcus sp. MISCRS1]